MVRAGHCHHPRRSGDQVAGEQRVVLPAAGRGDLVFQPRAGAQYRRGLQFSCQPAGLAALVFCRHRAHCQHCHQRVAGETRSAPGRAALLCRVDADPGRGGGQPHRPRALRLCRRFPRFLCCDLALACIQHRRFGHQCRRGSADTRQFSAGSWRRILRLHLNSIGQTIVIPGRRSRTRNPWGLLSCGQATPWIPACAGMTRFFHGSFAMRGVLGMTSFYFFRLE